MSRRWRRLYRRTDYVVLLDPPLCLRCGVRDARAETRLIAECGLRCSWTLLTACNPRSRRLGAAVNNARLRTLRLLLRRRRVRHWPTVHRDPAGRWPDERGVLLVDVPRAFAVGLGRRFRQNALVWGRVGVAATLVWLRRPDRGQPPPECRNFGCL